MSLARRRALDRLTKPQLISRIIDLEQGLPEPPECGCITTLDGDLIRPCADHA